VAEPRVEFLWWRECPSWERALADLRAAMAEAGFDPEALVETEIDTEDLASREAFVGSPTIRIDGEDIQPPGGDDAIGLNCRVYRRRDGRASPLPDPADLREALNEAARG
jgi:hypothetical protein